MGGPQSVIMGCKASGSECGSPTRTISIMCADDPLIRKEWPLTSGLYDKQLPNNTVNYMSRILLACSSLDLRLQCGCQKESKAALVCKC